MKCHKLPHTQCLSQANKYFLLLTTSDAMAPYLFEVWNWKQLLQSDEELTDQSLKRCVKVWPILHWKDVLQIEVKMNSALPFWYVQQWGDWSCLSSVFPIRSYWQRGYLRV